MCSAQCMDTLYHCVCRSVVELWRYMSKFTGVKILLGDLNAEPQSTPIRQVVINVLFVFMKLKL